MGRIFTILLVLTHFLAICQQQGISITPSGAAPDPSAMLDVNATNKGFLLPRLTTGQRDSINSPAFGLMILNTTTGCFEAYGFGQWQALSCMCSGPPSTPGLISGDANPCSAYPVIYTVPGVSGANSYTWTAPLGSIITGGQGTTSITVYTGSNSGNVSVTANNNCGSSSSSSLPVTINTGPATPSTITGNSTPCASSINTYSISAISGASSYTWTVPADATINSGQGTTSISVTMGTLSGSISVSASNSCGTSSASSLPVTVNSAPATPGGISGLSTFYANQSAVNYFISAVNGASSYSWTVPGDANIASGQGTNSISVNFGVNSGNICVTASNSCGTSSANCMAVGNCLVSGSQTFNYTGGLQLFTVPGCVTSVTIDAYGAQGGTSNSSTGGLGAEIKGTFSVSPSQVLHVVVGQVGYNNSGGSGGGGGSGVTYNGSPWVVAGGGGGVDGGSNSNTNGTTSNNGNAGDSNPGSGGTGGGDGGIQMYNGSNNISYGGNGINDGIDGSTGTNGYSVQTTVANGSFGLGGGGGGVGNSYCNCGGGGGGYSGGGSANINANGGGGGSYNAGSNQTNTSGVQSGNGLVIISW